MHLFTQWVRIINSPHCHCHINMASILCSGILSISIYVHLWEEADKTILRDFQRVNAFYLFFLIEDDTFTNTDIFGSRQITLKSHVAMFMIS